MVWGNRKEIAWQHGFEVAKKYHDTYGNLMVAGKYVAPDGYPLGQWILKTRQQKLNGRLKEERIAQLDEIGMVWSVFDAKWEKAYALAAAYYEENGNLNIPRSYVTASGERLGLWLASQQWSYPKGKLSDEQVERLNRIGTVSYTHLPGGVRPDISGSHPECPVSAGYSPVPDTLQGLSGTDKRWSHISGQAKSP